VTISVEKQIGDFFRDQDRRCAGKVNHRLIDIPDIAVCAAIACAGNWDDTALYDLNKLGWLQPS
jgi:hypothetical protein